MFLELDGTGDLYAQLARAVKRAILEGRLRAGTRLPSTRSLAADLALSRNTVVTAFDLLRAEQLIESRPGAGSFVAANFPARGATPRVPRGAARPQSRYAQRLRELPPLRLQRVQPPLRYDLQYGEPLVNLPLAGAWRTALGRAVVRSDLRYAASGGLRELRHAIAEYVARRRGIACTADDVVVVGGAQQAITLLARVLLDEGATAAIEDPVYELAEMTLKAHGAKLRPVPVDAAGLRVERLPGRGIRMVLVTPSHQFPSGAVMSIERRMALLDYADRTGAWIVEDDYDGEFRYAGPPLPALRSLDTSSRVIYVGSFSKTLFPALRLGYVICPPSLRNDLIAAKRLDDLGCPAIEQAALAELMSSGAFDRHLRHAANELRRRRTALLQGLARHAAPHVLVHDSGAGMHVVGWLPGWTPGMVDAFVDAARERNVGVQSIAPHFRRVPAPSGVLLGYAGSSPKQLGAAAALIGECLNVVAKAYLHRVPKRRWAPEDVSTDEMQRR